MLFHNRLIYCLQIIELSKYLQSSDAVQELTTMINQVLNFLSNEGREELLQDQLNRILVNAHKDYDCPSNSQNIMRHNSDSSNTSFDSNIEMGVSNLNCSEITVTDIKLDYNGVNASLFELNLAITDLDIQCKLDWK